MNTTGKKFGGRAKGTKNRTPKETKNAIALIVNSEIDKLPEMLEKLKVKDRADILIKLLAFVLPKKLEIEADVNVDNFTTVLVQIEPLKIDG